MATLTEACRLSKGVTLIGSECVVKSFLDRINNAEEALCDIRKKIRAASSDLNRFCTFPTTVPIPVVPSIKDSCVLDQQNQIILPVTYLVSPNDLDKESYDFLKLMEQEVCATLKKIKLFGSSLSEPCSEVPDPDPDPDPDTFNCDPNMPRIIEVVAVDNPEFSGVMLLTKAESGVSCYYKNAQNTYVLHNFSLDQFWKLYKVNQGPSYDVIAIVNAYHTGRTITPCGQYDVQGVYNGRSVYVTAIECSPNHDCITDCSTKLTINSFCGGQNISFPLYCNTYESANPDFYAGNCFYNHLSITPEVRIDAMLNYSIGANTWYASFTITNQLDSTSFDGAGYMISSSSTNPRGSYQIVENYCLGGSITIS